MKLIELEPCFLKITNPNSFSTEVPIEEADGLRFLCPVCFKTNAGPVGTHSIICWRPRVPATQTPGPGRWELLGTGFADLSLQAGSSSVRSSSAPCRAHFFVRSGEIVFC